MGLCDYLFSIYLFLPYVFIHYTICLIMEKIIITIIFGFENMMHLFIISLQKTHCH